MPSPKLLIILLCWGTATLASPVVIFQKQSPQFQLQQPFPVTSSTVENISPQQTQSAKPVRYKSCEATYGKGWERCGGPESIFCYNPSIGHSCCEIDNSHCPKGTYCAPVAGYCCLEGEDLATCARNAGFALPEHENDRFPEKSPDL